MCTKNADFLYIFQVWWTISLWSQIRVQVRKREMRNAGQEDVCATFFSKHWPKVQYWFEFLSFFFQILVEQNILDLLFLANAMHWAHFCAQHPALGTLRAISNKRWAKVWWAGHTDLLYVGPGIQGILQKPQRISLHRDKALWNPTACSTAHLDAWGRIAYWFWSGGGQGNDIQSLAPTITKFGSGLNCKGR